LRRPRRLVRERPWAASSGSSAGSQLAAACSCGALI
jgi:hypothetical protein